MATPGKNTIKYVEDDSFLEGDVVLQVWVHPRRGVMMLYNPETCIAYYDTESLEFLALESIYSENYTEEELLDVGFSYECDL